MRTLYDEILHKPLFNLLVFLYENVTFQDLGLAILALTILIRLILFPIFHKTTEHQKIIQKLQPRIKNLQEEHKGNREAQTRAILALYKEHKISPFGPLPMLIIQGFVLFALFNIFMQGLTDEAFTALYSFIPRPEIINDTFLGLINISLPNIFLVVIAALAQYYQGRLSVPKVVGVPTQQEQLARNMVFLGPILTLVIFWNLPAAIGLYWLTSTLFSIGQYFIVERKLVKGVSQLESGTANK